MDFNPGLSIDDIGPMVGSSGMYATANPSYTFGTLPYQSKLDMWTDLVYQVDVDAAIELDYMPDVTEQEREQLFCRKAKELLVCAEVYAGEGSTMSLMPVDGRPSVGVLYAAPLSNTDMERSKTRTYLQSQVNMYNKMIKSRREKQEPSKINIRVSNGLTDERSYAFGISNQLEYLRA